MTAGDADRGLPGSTDTAQITGPPLNNSETFKNDEFTFKCHESPVHRLE